MKKQDQPSMSWVPENQASFIAGRGWKSSNCSSLPVEGQKFSLTFPFIEQAIAILRYLFASSQVPGAGVISPCHPKTVLEGIRASDLSGSIWSFRTSHGRIFHAETPGEPSSPGFHKTEGPEYWT